MTANHCLEGEDAISNPNCELEFWWHYESPNCDNLETNPDYYVTTEGATVLANDSVLDFALLELDEDPDDNPNIMTYYLGWDRKAYLGAGDSTAVGIHHPQGDIKKISTSNNIQSDGNHWMVFWKETEHGHSVTESVSSGSPLINGNNHVIGCLFGGSSYNCSDPYKDTANYNKLDRAWFGDDATDNRRKLQPWLDPLNTGVRTLDGLFGTSNVNLYIRDSITDIGNTPSNVKYMYNSPDIWIGDSLGNPVDDIYGGGSYYVCVRIHNKRAVSSTGTEKLYLNWAKAGVNLPWPSGWDGTTQLDCGKYPPMGGMVGDSICYTIPMILPYNSAVVKIPWTTPDAEEYNCGIFEGSAEQWHFCLLARVHDSEPIEGENTDSCDIGYFVTHNNNVAWKNLTVLGGHSNRAVVWLQNHFKEERLFTLRFNSPINSKNEPLYKYAETYIRFSPNVVAGWQEGGSEGNGFEQVEEHRFFIPESSAEFKNILLPPNSIGMLETEVNFFSDIVPECGEFTFDIAMHDEKGETLYGGEHYKVIRDPERVFEVKALENQVVMPETSITFNAVNIGEPATYVWYNAAGDSIASGTTLHTTATQSQQYRLSVQATADGYKGYDTVSVVVRNGAITAISPNPATNQAVVSYTLSNQVQSGTVQIANTTGIVLSSTAFTASQTSTTLNLQNLVAGQYSVRLVSSTGEVLDSKTLIVQ